MAALTPEEFVPFRQRLARRFTPQTWNKSQVNAVIQSIEDQLVVTQNTLNGAAESAAPGVFNNAQKKLLIALAIQRYGEGEEV